MPVTRKKKEEAYKNLSEGLKSSKSVVFVNFHGLTVADSTELRRKLRESGIKYSVAKKTIAGKVLEEQSYSGNMPELTGELAIAWGEDLIAPAREVNEFEKKFKDRVKILGGIFEGVYKDRDAMKSIAMIPTREVLLSQIAYLLKSPMQRFAIAVSEVAKKRGA
ncbi:MAG TPA: 50S ribosomal protein L10 [Candidatus Paceibacterota bacterium]